MRVEARENGIMKTGSYYSTYCMCIRTGFANGTFIIYIYAYSTSPWLNWNLLPKTSHRLYPNAFSCELTSFCVISVVIVDRRTPRYSRIDRGGLCKILKYAYEVVVGTYVRRT